MTNSARVLILSLCAAFAGCADTRDEGSPSQGGGKADGPLGSHVDLSNTVNDIRDLRDELIGFYENENFDSANVRATDIDWKLTATLRFGERDLELELIYDIFNHSYYGFLSEPTDEPCVESIQYAYAVLWLDDGGNVEFGFHGIRNPEEPGSTPQENISSGRMKISD